MQISPSSAPAVTLSSHPAVFPPNSHAVSLTKPIDLEFRVERTFDHPIERVWAAYRPGPHRQQRRRHQQGRGRRRERPAERTAELGWIIGFDGRRRAQPVRDPTANATGYGVIRGGSGRSSAMVFVRWVWSRHSDLNRGPAVYETAALPLSYVGARPSIEAAPGRRPDGRDQAILRR